jgi:hypothetical protein
MLRKATGIAGAIAAGTLLTAALIDVVLSPMPAEVATNAVGQSGQINRGNKGDSLPKSANSGTPRRITTVEVVGVENTAIVYRDRDGNVLFKTDPVSNVTMVAKDVQLPEVTIRELASSNVQIVAIEDLRPTLSPTLSPTAPGDGCEPSVPAYAGNEKFSQEPSRCITAQPASTSIASVN